MSNTKRAAKGGATNKIAVNKNAKQTSASTPTKVESSKNQKGKPKAKSKSRAVPKQHPKRPASSSRAHRSPSVAYADGMASTLLNTLQFFNERVYGGISVGSSLEVITYEEAVKVLYRDTHLLLTEKDFANDSKRGAFIFKNAFNYYLCINTWLLLVESVSINASHALRVRISQKGLIDTIKFYCGVSDSIIRDSIESSWDNDAFGVVSWLLQDTNDLHLILQLLRYPKKLSLTGATLIDQVSLEGFFEVNADCKRHNQSEYPYWLVEALRVKIAEMLKYYKLDEANGYFSSGSTEDAGRILIDKVNQYSKAVPYIYDPSFVLPVPQDYCGIERYFGTNRRRSAVLIKAVPKSYKASRIIAEEPAANQFRMLAIATSLREAMRRSGYSRYCDTTDQSRNRELCRKASISGAYATIDKSHASDSVTDTLVSSIFPPSIVKQFEECRSIYVTDGKIRRVMQMFATSGSGLTFDVESIVFTALALVAGDYYRLFTRTTRRVLDPSVFGDDVIIDDRVADTYIDFCGLLGFTVNVDKTFAHAQTDGYYRESCGVEYYNGIDVASCYYPRKPLHLKDANSLASIVSLQKRLYSFFKVNLFLRDVIFCLEPRMTSHLVGTDCDDMWTEEPIYRESKRGHLHLCLTTKKARKLSEDKRQSWEYRVLEHYYYYNFLVRGPRYADGISRLLHVSDPIRSDSDVTGTRVEWSYIVEN